MGYATHFRYTQKVQGHRASILWFWCLPSSYLSLFLFFLRKAVISLSKKNIFTEFLLATYLKQLHLYLFLQLAEFSAQELLQCSFTPITSEVFYAYALYLQALCLPTRRSV